MYVLYKKVTLSAHKRAYVERNKNIVYWSQQLFYSPYDTNIDSK